MRVSITRIMSKKGQGLTEYVLVLAFVAGIAMMISGGGLVNTLKGTVASVADVFASITGSDSGSRVSLNLPAAISGLKELATNKTFNGSKIKGTESASLGNAAGYQNSSAKGFIRSEWFTDALLKKYPEIAALAEGLGAESWVFYQNDNGGYGGLYWTPENLQTYQDNGQLTKKGDYILGNDTERTSDASNEYVLYLNYNPKAADDKKFVVMQSQVWLDQKDMAPIGSQTADNPNVTSAPALSIWAQAGSSGTQNGSSFVEKEKAVTVSEHGSLEEAQQAYAKYKESQGVVQQNQFTNSQINELKKL